MRKRFIALIACIALLLALGAAGCGPASTPRATFAPAAVAIVLTPTPPAPVQIDLTLNTASKDLAQWTARCAQNTTGKPITDLTEIEPFKAVVLAFYPKSKQWESNRDFPTLINTTGEPKYLVCLFKTRTFIANYNTSDNNTLPGYREDWKITVQVLDTKEIYETQSLIGQEPAYSVTYFQSNTPVTEIVGVPPLDKARSVLLAKQSIPVASATLSIPYGFQSIDFAPDSRSLYVPFEDGFHKWDFTANTWTPLSFQAAPTSCDKSGRAIHTSFDGKYLVTTCYTGDSKFATEIWAADTLQQTAKFHVLYFINPQFELQEQKRIISYASYTNAITTLDLSTGEVQSSPPKLEGDIRWVSPHAKYAITYKSSTHEYQIWDLAEQKILNSFGSFQESQVSRDGRLLFSQDARGNVTILVRDVQTMQPLLSVIADPHSTYEVSPNGRLLAVLTRNKVTIIDLQTKSLLVTIPVENPGKSILFSPDGKTIALPAGAIYSDSYYSSPLDVVVFGTGFP